MIMIARFDDRQHTHAIDAGGEVAGEKLTALLTQHAST